MNMEKNVGETLGQFNDSDLTVKLLSAMYSVIPFSPGFAFYNSLEGAVQRYGGGAPQMAKAQEIAASPEVQQAVWMAATLDTSDQLIAGYAGVKNLFSFFSSNSGEKRTFEADNQQALDAALKATGLAFMIYRLYPGGVTEKVTQFKNTKAGQEAAIFFALGEVALPFSDNLVESGGNLVSRLMNNPNIDLSGKFGQFVGAEQFNQAKEMMGQLTAPLDGVLEQAKQYTGPVIQKIQSYLPSGGGAMNIADSATGVAATGVDLMPVWTFLGARLAAEACAMRAMS
ncbi:MAG: hypothetical protein KDK30_11740 [Leptospiraceae bacterium]|nr:hypothetical protein [Leptospiraceae bacterium]